MKKWIMLVSVLVLMIVITTGCNLDNLKESKSEDTDKEEITKDGDIEIDDNNIDQTDQEDEIDSVDEEIDDDMGNDANEDDKQDN